MLGFALQPTGFATRDGFEVGGILGLAIVKHDRLVSGRYLEVDAIGDGRDRNHRIAAAGPDRADAHQPCVGSGRKHELAPVGQQIELDPAGDRRQRHHLAVQRGAQARGLSHR